jgi:hypothetical protein
MDSQRKKTALSPALSQQIGQIAMTPNTLEASDRQVGGTHYQTMTIQPWDAMTAWMTHEQFTGFLLGQALKYLARVPVEGVPGKGGITDARKAQHCLEKLVEHLAGGV